MTRQTRSLNDRSDSDNLHMAVLRLRDQLSSVSSDTALIDLLDGLDQVAAEEDYQFADWAAGVLAPVQRVLERADKNRRDSLADLVATVAAPCVAVSVAGLLLASNQGALAHPILQQGVVGALCSTAEFEACLMRCRAPGRGAAILLSNLREGFLVCGWSEAHSAALITLPLWSWPAGLELELQAALKLTPRETEIVGAMMQGLGPEAIAARDGRSVGTLRQQLKAIFAKLGVSGQGQVVALIAGLAQSWQAVRPAAAQADGEVALRRDQITRGARSIGLRRFGRPGGRPVLLIHGALFGAADFAAERYAAEHAGFEVLAVERPGFGRSSDTDGNDGRDAAVADILAAMDHAGLGRVPVIAQDVGLATACRLAKVASQRVAGIVAAPSTPPMKMWAQTDQMPRGQRVHAWVAQKAPRLLDLVVSLGLAHVRSRGASILPDLFFPGCDFDRDVLAKPALRAGLEGAMQMIAAQNAKGFRRDMLVTNMDWSDDCAGLAVPLVLMHGAESRTVSLDAVQAFADGVAGARVVVVPNAGHSLPLTHATEVYFQIEAVVKP